MPVLTTVTVGAFVRELVCGLDTLPALLDTWGLTQEEFEQLRRGEAFQKELRTAVNDVRDMGRTVRSSSVARYCPRRFWRTSSP